MIRLIYSSCLADSITWSDLLDIVQHSKINNDKKEITGFLIAYNRQILQVLEGESDVVSRLLISIGSDQRHHSLRLICAHEIFSRDFSQWKMKEVNVERLAMASQGWIKELFETQGSDISLPRDALSAYTLLRSIYHITSTV